MDNFLPAENITLLYIPLATLAIVMAGYGIIRMENKSWARALSWSMAILATFLAHYFTLENAPGYRMLAIIIILFTSMKVIVTNEYSRTHERLTFLQWTAFAIGWFGMNPGVFARKDLNKQSQGWQLILYGTSRIGIGFCIFIFGWLLSQQSIFCCVYSSFIAAFLLAGLSFMLHFGILNINSGIWNLLGIGTYALFRAPFKSPSLSEFWGRRWNFAFSEMISISVHRPLKNIANNTLATIIAFAFSGILHELAISLPVNRGYGLPSLYFVIQAIGLIAEKKLKLKSAFLRHVWVLIWLIAPISLLFHRYFLEGVIWPLLP